MAERKAVFIHKGPRAAAGKSRRPGCAFADPPLPRFSATISHTLPMGAGSRAVPESKAVPKGAAILHRSRPSGSSRQESRKSPDLANSKISSPKRWSALNQRRPSHFTGFSRGRSAARRTVVQLATMKNPALPPCGWVAAQDSQGLAGTHSAANRRSPSIETCSAACITPSPFSSAQANVRGRSEAVPEMRSVRSAYRLARSL